MDLNGDGHNDVISGSWPGELYFFAGRADGTHAKGEMLRDKNGKVICVGSGVNRSNGMVMVTGGGTFKKDENGNHYIDLHGEKITAGKDEQLVMTGTAAAVHAADWDRDGDFDLFVGDIDGHIHVLINEGTATEPKWGKASRLKMGLLMPIKIPGGDAAPFVVDWDGDGDLDLLSGAGNGSVQYFENVTKGTKPVLAQPVALIPAGTSGYGKNAPARPTRGTRSKVWVTDWNGDGRLDILVGDYANQKPAPKEYTDAEKAEHAKLRKEFAIVQRRYAELSQKLHGPNAEKDPEKAAAISKQFDENLDRYREIQRALPVESEPHGWVWLFLRKSK